MVGQPACNRAWATCRHREQACNSGISDMPTHFIAGVSLMFLAGRQLVFTGRQNYLNGTSFKASLYVVKPGSQNCPPHQSIFPVSSPF